MCASLSLPSSLKAYSCKMNTKCILVRFSYNSKCEISSTLSYFTSQVPFPVMIELQTALAALLFNRSASYNFIYLLRLFISLQPTFWIYIFQMFAYRFSQYHHFYNHNHCHHHHRCHRSGVSSRTNIQIWVFTFQQNFKQFETLKSVNHSPQLNL